MGAVRRYFLVGGAGFIGSHFTDHLLGDSETEAVTIYDNFSSGREWHYQHHSGDPRLRVIRGDVKDTDRLTEAMSGHDTVIHLASNPDIARAAKEPDVDFREGIFLTHCVVEAMRTAGARSSYTLPAAACTENWGRRKRPKILVRLCPYPLMEPASLQGKLW